jgi:hypothetical protein
MAAKSDEQGKQTNGHEASHSSTALRAVTAAAATGAAAYAARRIKARTANDAEDDAERGDETDERERDESESGGGITAKKDEVVDVLSSKVADAKHAAAKLRRGGGDSRSSSIARSAWSSASEHLLPVAGEAASALGEKAAKKAPELLRKEIIPRFIEGFEKAS